MSLLYFQFFLFSLFVFSVCVEHFDRKKIQKVNCGFNKNTPITNIEDFNTTFYNMFKSSFMLKLVSYKIHSIANVQVTGNEFTSLVFIWHGLLLTRYFWTCFGSTSNDVKTVYVYKIYKIYAYFLNHVNRVYSNQKFRGTIFGRALKSIKQNFNETCVPIKYFITLVIVKVKKIVQFIFISMTAEKTWCIYQSLKTISHMLIGISFKHWEKLLLLILLLRCNIEDALTHLQYWQWLFNRESEHNIACNITIFKK